MDGMLFSSQHEKKTVLKVQSLSKKNKGYSPLENAVNCFPGFSVYT